MSTPSTATLGSARSGSYPPPAMRQGWREAVRVWWSELDRVLLLLIALLLGLGVVAVLAASPASADQLSTREVTLVPMPWLWRDERGLLPLPRQRAPVWAYRGFDNVRATDAGAADWI